MSHIYIIRTSKHIPTIVLPILEVLIHHRKSAQGSWYYAQFSLQRLGCNCYKFQKVAIYNDERQIDDNVIC